MAKKASSPVAAWKSTFLLPAMTPSPMSTHKSRSLSLDGFATVINLNLKINRKLSYRRWQPDQRGGRHRPSLDAQMNGRNRAHIRPGARVKVVQKQDQRSGKLTEGVVKDILTHSSSHPHGIKVRLVSGVVGRVKEVLSPDP
jgi:uncharacterized repeat protein (TIGR03833 family)